jgi:hypothetical protein
MFGFVQGMVINSYSHVNVTTFNARGTDGLASGYLQRARRL